MSLRVGLGLDSHRLAPGVQLMLGTLAIDHPEGLVGHSDGDVVAHALCDALLSATGGPDLGQLFPAEPEWAGASGERLLRAVLDRISHTGATVVNAHAVIVCEKPRISPYRDGMQEALTTIVGAPVTVHATTTDALGAIGRGEGIACQVVALVNVP